MNETNFVFMADAHVKKRTWTNSATLQDDSYTALDALGSVIAGMPEAAGGIPLVVGGDWFDSARPSASDAAVTESFLKTFSKVYYINGNHDSTEPGWLSVCRPDAVHLSPSVLNALGPSLYITGADWTPGQEGTDAALQSMAAAASKLPAGDILYVVLHASLRQLLGFEGAYQLDMARLAELFSPLAANTIVLIGDIHTRKTLKAAHNVFVHSPGALYPLSRADMAAKHSVTRMCGGKLYRIDSDVRRYECVTFESMPQLRKLAEEMAADHSMPLQPMLLVDVPADAQDFQGFSGKDYGILVHTSRQDSVQEAQQVQEDVPVARMLDAVDIESGDNTELRDTARMLLGTDDPVGVLDTWLGEHKVERV